MRFLHLLISLVLFALLSPAQIGTGIITGRVTDSSGAVIPGVSITVVNSETNFRFAASTNPEGLFRVQSLQPGPYRVAFEAAGFKRLVRENVALRTGDVLAVDAALEVGALTESVEVTAAPPLLETQTSATGTVTAGEYLYTLPIFQRFTNYVLNLVPGVTSGRTWAETLSGFYVAGQRSTPSFFEDGVIGQDQGAGTNTVKVIQNAIAEIQVLTTALPAEYGHSAGGAISVVTKTGTNELHGLASVYGRSRRMQHRRFFDMYRNSAPRPGAPKGQQAFVLFPDFNLSGPVVLPKVYDGRKRTFFFIAYQKYIEKMRSTQYYGAVPDADMKNGNFNFGGVGNPLYDPASTRQLPNGSWTRDPIPGSIIPRSRFDPVAQKILEIDPWNSPNLPGTFTSNGPVQNFRWAEYARSFKPDFLLRFDHQFSPKFKISGSSTYNSNAGLGRLSTIRINEYAGSAGGASPWGSSNWTVGGTWVASPTTINDTRIGYYRRRSWHFQPAHGRDWGKELGIPNIQAGMLPSLAVGYGLDGTTPSQNVGETLSFRNDLTKIRGRHALKMGYEAMRLRQNNWNTGNYAGSFSFDSAFGLQASGASMPRTGNTFAGFLLGWVRQSNFDLQLASYLPRSYIHSFYIQDDWRLSPKLTFNLGLRYMNETPFTTKHMQLSQWDATVIDGLTGRTGSVVHPKAPLSGRDNNNFQPRIGVAWNPLKKWVFRGGFAVNTVDVKFPGGQFDEYTARVVQQRAPGDPRPLYRISQGPDPVLYDIRPDGSSPYVGTNYGSRNSTRWDPATRNPYGLNWNLSIQHELIPNYLLELMYQGSAGIGLIESWQLNTLPVDYGAGNPSLRTAVLAAAQNYRPYPHFGSVNLRSNFGHSAHHSGTVKFEKRYSRALNFLTFYTFSKTTDSGASVAPLQNRSLGKARASYDYNHRFVGSVSYELPLGKGKRFLNRGGIWNHIFGGYQVVWIQTLQSGAPMTFDFANSPYNYYPTWVSPRRPDYVKSCAMRDNWRDIGGDRWNIQNQNPVLDINCFAYPAEFTPGNAGRNIVSGPGIRWSQASAQKQIMVGERVQMLVRWDMNNVLKTFSFANPTTTVDFQNPRTFGKLTDDTTTSSFGGAPIMHLTLQLTF